MKSLKQILFQQCVNLALQRIDTARTALASAREASNDETKSSAGDKYETSREMAQQDIDRNRRLLSEAEAQIRVLESLASDDDGNEQVRLGSLISTNHGHFYLAISIGQVIVADKSFFVISPSSPIGALMLHKKRGESVSFNGKVYLIASID